KVVTEKELVQNHEGVLPKSNSGMWNSKMSLRGARFLTAFGTGCVIS
ncbi:unnamed protein product, partial [marine sediment metagenome]